MNVHLLIISTVAAVSQAKMKMKESKVATAISKACVDARAVAKRRSKTHTDDEAGKCDST